MITVSHNTPVDITSECDLGSYRIAPTRGSEQPYDEAFACYPPGWLPSSRLVVDGRSRHVRAKTSVSHHAPNMKIPERLQQ